MRRISVSRACCQPQIAVVVVKASAVLTRAACWHTTPLQFRIRAYGWATHLDDSGGARYSCHELSGGIAVGVRRAILSGVAVGVASTLPQAVSAPSAVAHPCQGVIPFPGGLFAGRYDNSSPSSWIGASSRVKVRGSVMCNHPSPSFNNNFYAGWALLSGQRKYEYSQAGYDRTFGQAAFRRHFAQAAYNFFGSPAVESTFTMQEAQDSQVYKYWATYDPSCSCLKMGVNDWLLEQTSWNPFDYWVKPFRPQYSIETGDSFNPVPGDPGNPVEFGSLSIRRASDGAWINWTESLFPLVGRNDAIPPNTPDWRVTDTKSTCVNGPRCFEVYTNGAL
jgi:hypothetical protein